MIILPRSRHLPVAVTDGSLTENLNRNGVRLWTDPDETAPPFAMLGHQRSEGRSPGQRKRVLIDIDSVPLGIDFVDHVTDQISGCSAVIVMIGKQWLTIKDKKRRRRLEREDDLVRAEIRAALQQKVPVIPVVVQNASMPVAEELPDELRPLARRNGIQLRPEQWKDGVDRLLKELDKVMKK